jgi:hypothetical protein
MAPTVTVIQKDGCVKASAAKVKMRDIPEMKKGAALRSV